MRIAHFWAMPVKKGDVVAPGHAGCPRRIERVSAAPPLQFGVVVNGDVSTLPGGQVMLGEDS
jgi:hypothetical protein